ncbi:VOC family protein [Gilvimarinus sp. F26214L]|uniref:VOC family protein n=1 Tax=Gilvimarinus sp. DZF01 TaxID=3461371 RepID=UPI004045AFD3
MHRSRLGGFIIDCHTDDLESAAQFWSAALGMPITDDKSEKYIQLEDPGDRLSVEVQRVEHPSRVHLDIQADDIEAEVKRLEKLGARKVEAVATWVVMEAPTGQRFCVVRPQSDNFEKGLNTWE